MKVIIKKTNEVKEVSFGYAVNYLIPNNLAALATDDQLVELEKQKTTEKQQNLEKRKIQKTLADRLSGKKLIIKVKAGKGKKIFGSVGKKDILKALKIEKEKVDVLLDKAIKELGEHKVDLKIGEQKISIRIEIKRK